MSSPEVVGGDAERQTLFRLVQFDMHYTNDVGERMGHVYGHMYGLPNPEKEGAKMLDGYIKTPYGNFALSEEISIVRAFVKDLARYLHLKERDKKQPGFLDNTGIGRRVLEIEKTLEKYKV